MSTPGYLTTVEITGASVAMTGEAMVGSGAGPYQVAAAKRVLNAAVALTFKDNGVTISAGDISSIDYLLGKVTFTGSKTGPITVDGAYLPRLTLAESRSADLTLTADELDTTVFDSTGWRTSMQGLKKASGTIESLTLILTDLDPGAGSRKLSDLFTNGTQFVLSLIPGGSGDAYRFYASLFEISEGASVEDLVNTSIPYVSQAVQAANGDWVTVSIGT